MSNRKIGWAFSAERPVAVQSPSMMPLSDIQTRLNFSTTKSPSSLHKKKPLIAISRTPKTQLSTVGNAPQRSINSRITDYHMSKQNPDVLDCIYSSSPQNGYSPFGSQHPSTSLYNSRPGSTSSSPGVPFQNRTPHTPIQMSLLRQTLNASKSQSLSRSSLVQLATQRSSVRLNSGSLISPVVVRLSRGATPPRATPPPQGARGEEGVARLANGGVSNESIGNPCDKDTVLSALRSKRKRWASSAIDECSSTLSLASDQPSAKRSKQGSHDTVSVSTGRKRPVEPVTTDHSSDTTNKRSKILKPTPKRDNRICMPEIEYESDTENAQTDEPVVRFTKGQHLIGHPVEKTVAASPSEEDNSVQMMEIDKEMVKKREDSLSKLRTVFPSAKSEKSLRREVPVFCATGQKPHMPSSLSSTYSATREDLLKDREAAAKRLNHFLASEDEVSPSTSTAVATSSSSLTSTTIKPSLETALKLPVTASNMEPDSTTTTSASISIAPSTDSLKDSLKLSSVSGKSVSFASPIASSIPSTTTTVSSLSTAGLTSTTSSGLTLPQIGLQASFGSSKNEAAASLKVSGGGLSLGNIQAAPPNGPATTSSSVSQATLVLSLTQATAANTLKIGTNTATVSSISSSGLSFATPGTQSNVLQLSTAAALSTTTTPAPGVTTTQSILTQQQTQASSVQFGVPNLTTSIQGVSAAQPSSGGFLLGNSSTASLGANKPTALFGVNASSIANTTSSTQQQSGLTQSANMPAPLSSGLSFGTAQKQGVGLLPGNTSQGGSPLLGLKVSQGGGFLFKNTSQGGSPSLGLKVSQGGGLSLGNGNSLSVQQPSGGILFGNNVPAATAAPKPTAATSTAQQASAGLLFGNSAGSTQASTSGLLFGNSASNLASDTQQSTGLLFGSNSKSTSTAQQCGSGGLLFGNNTTSGNAQQPVSGLLFGKGASSASSTQVSTSGSLFGNSLTNAQQTGSGIFGTSATVSTATTQVLSGLSTGNNSNNAMTGSNSTQPPGGLMFGNNATSSSGFSFNVTQTKQNSLFGTQATNQASKPATTGLLFGSTQNATNPTTAFSFTAGGASQHQQQSMFSGGANTQQPMTLNFGAGQSQLNTQSNSVSSLFGGNSASNSMFGGAQSNSSSEFTFTGNQQQQKPGQVNLNQAELKFGMGQSQNGNGSNNTFSFKANSSGQSGLGTGLSNASGSSGLSIGQGNVFNSHQPSNLGGFQFTPLPSQQAFNFTANTPSQPSFNFSASTPTPNPFAGGTPGDVSSRSTSRARRRGRKK